MLTSPTREMFEVRRDATAQPLQLTVILGDPGAPALYVLDAGFLLDVTAGVMSMLRTMARLVGEPFPDLTLVGIGYPTDDPGQIFALRARDLTPTRGQLTTAMNLPPLDFGGAEEFLCTVVDEVVPAVEARYEVDGVRRGLAGFSFGGLFGMYTLLHRPDSFSDYLMGSPSLWWDDGLPLVWEEEWAAKHADLAAQVFLWVGSNEQLIGDSWKNERFPLSVLQRLAQVDRVQDLAQRLDARRYPSLRVDCTVLDGEYHLTAPAAGLTRGLLAAFERDDARFGR
ncbi:hypothetical protein GCM10009789_35630 [Kribbella sancticallisti]|uniref:Esterase n=1 Tax=Kribbella sancticallisti TaxID=460087 RepID=A0ABN2DLZ6_9ACTN